jgi:hypothetical protein
VLPVKLLSVDWNIVLFTGASILHDYWVTLGLPQVYYWQMNEQQETIKQQLEESDDKIA